MSDELPAKEPPVLRVPSELFCRDGGEHDWRLIKLNETCSYYFCQKCGLEKGRPKSETGESK
jgi:hypothetical protein